VSTLFIYITPWSWVHLEESPVVQLPKSFPAFYGTLVWSWNWPTDCRSQNQPQPQPPGWGSLKWDSKIWSWVLQDLDPRLTTLARPISNCMSKLQANPLVREGVPHQETLNCQRKNLVICTRWEPDTKMDWPIERRS
jgi:hypothetical protein